MCERCGHDPCTVAATALGECLLLGNCQTNRKRGGFYVDGRTSCDSAIGLENIGSAGGANSQAAIAEAVCRRSSARQSPSSQRLGGLSRLFEKPHNRRNNETAVAIGQRK